MFSKRLKECRIKNRWKQHEVAEQIGVGLRTYQGYESGKSEPKYETLIALADFFDVTLDYLMGRTDS